MVEKLFAVFVLLSLLNQLSSLSVDAGFQKAILTGLELEEPPTGSSDRATACIDYLKSLKDAGNEYNEIDCLDQLGKSRKKLL